MRWVTTLVVAGLLLAACGDSGESSDSEDVYGVWVSPGNSSVLMSFNEDDTWNMTHKEDPERIRDSGPFTFDGELLTLVTDPASLHCSRNSGAYDAEITGTYEAAITSEGNLELTEVDDACVQRRVGSRGTFVPYSP